MHINRTNNVVEENWTLWAFIVLFPKNMCEDTHHSMKSTKIQQTKASWMLFNQYPWAKASQAKLLIVHFFIFYFVYFVYFLFCIFFYFLFCDGMDRISLKTWMVVWCLCWLCPKHEAWFLRASAISVRI